MPYSPAMLAALAGFGLGLSLIVAIGAQNVFVLRQGVRVEHVGWVVGICSLSDLALIVAGTAGAGVVVLHWPVVLVVARYFAAAFLLTYGLLAARRVVWPIGMRTDDLGRSTPLLQTITTCLAFTWLNPHVYLDTVVLLGSVAQTHHGLRWWFAAGAALGDMIWFVALGYSARALRPIFARPAAWRVLDCAVATIMIGLAALLALQT